MPCQRTKRAEQVDPVRRAELGTQLGAERRLLRSVRQQRRRRQRRDRALQAMDARCSLPGEDHELLGDVGELLVGRRHALEQVVDERSRRAGSRSSVSARSTASATCRARTWGSSAISTDAKRGVRPVSWSRAASAAVSAGTRRHPRAAVGSRRGLPVGNGAPLWHAARRVPDERVHMIDVRAPKPAPVQLQPPKRRSQQRHSASTRPRQTEGRSSRE